MHPSFIPIRSDIEMSDSLCVGLSEAIEECSPGSDLCFNLESALRARQCDVDSDECCIHDNIDNRSHEWACV